MELLVAQSKKPDQILSTQERDEIRDLFPEYLMEVFKLGNIPEIERRIASARRFDKSDIQAILDIIKNEAKNDVSTSEYSLPLYEGKKRYINPATEIDAIEKSLTYLQLRF